MPAFLMKKVMSWVSPTTIGHSMTMRASLAVVFIASTIFISSIYSFYLAKTAENDAQAINDAGSIRMAAYRINYELARGLPSDATIDFLKNDMNQRLDKLTDYQAKNSNQNPDIDNALLQLKQDWHNVLLPALERQSSTEFYQHSLVYLDDVNDFVTAIGLRNETRQKRQKSTQLISLVIVSLVMLIGMWELRRNALVPLKNLTNTARHFRQGKFLEVQAGKMDVKGYQELNELSDAFFAMLTLINNHQTELEAQVRQKTYHLTQSNKALYSLYHFAEKIATTHHLNSEELHKLIKDFSHLLPDSEISLCIHGQNFENNVIMSVSGRKHHDFCTLEDCMHCELKADFNTRIIPIKSMDTSWGELLVREPASKDGQIPVLNIDDGLSKQDLLLTLAHLIALTFMSNQRQKQAEELILAEERNTFARELHDSIAQTLSHLKIQSAMLKTLGKQEAVLLDNEPNLQNKETLQKIRQKQDKVRNELNEGTSHAYAQLRDLLNTFRLKVDGGDFNDAMQMTMKEFETKGGFNIHYDNQVLTLNLSASEQVDLLQITREALSNIHKHAYAKNAHIILYQDSISYDVVLRISDDGIGIRQSDKEKPEHYGLSTMSERTLRLGGTISTEPIRPKGTEVMVRFLPQFFLKQLKTPRPTPSLHEWSDEKVCQTRHELIQELDDEFGKTAI